MENILIQKTHYEAVKDLFQQGKFHFLDFKSFVIETEAYCGRNPSYESFGKSPFLQQLQSLPKSDISQITIFANVLYHLYLLYQQHERIYYVCPKLAMDLAHTELNVDTRFLRAPFSEIYIQIDPGLYYISDSVGEHPVRGFYVNLREEGEVKVIRIMAAALKTSFSTDDALFYFRIIFGPGKVHDQFQKYLDEVVTKNEQELKVFGGYHNIGHIKELFLFVFNLLLYITSKDADILQQFPMKFNAKLKGLKNKSKINKILLRQSKVSHLPVLVVGSKVASNYPIEKIKSSGGIGKWKLEKKIYVSGHWRIQWYGSGDTHRSELLFIKPYEKGPEIAEIISRHYKVS
jgi:hypothetical protein